MPSSPPPDRYEPLPGLLELPSFLLRKLSRRGRRIAMLLALAAALSAVGAALFVVPEARRGERDRIDARDRAARTAALALSARLSREARPRTARGPAQSGSVGPAALRRRRALFAAVEASVLADARGRRRTGELRGGPYRSSACFTYPKGLERRPPPEVPGLEDARLECLAVSSDVRADERTTGSLIGQPYRARVNFSTGRYAWCKIVQRAGELAIGRQPPVSISHVCGGDS